MELNAVEWNVTVCVKAFSKLSKVLILFQDPKLLRLHLTVATLPPSGALHLVLAYLIPSSCTTYLL